MRFILVGQRRMGFLNNEKFSVVSLVVFFVVELVGFSLE